MLLEAEEGALVRAHALAVADLGAGQDQPVGRPASGHVVHLVVEQPFGHLLEEGLAQRGVIVDKQHVRARGGGQGAVAVGAEAAARPFDVGDGRELAQHHVARAVVGAVVGDDQLVHGRGGGLDRLQRAAQVVGPVSRADAQRERRQEAG
ncbi:hypothetical protein D3C85_1298010 [compost metagenome]